MKLDTLDLKILSLLQNSSMLTPKLSEIAKSIGTTNATVYRRIEALKKEGVIVGHTTMIDTKMIGKSFRAFVYIKLPRNLSQEERVKITHRFSELDPVESVYEPVGKWSYILKTSHQNMDELDAFIKTELAKIPCEELQVEMILNIVKEGRTALPKPSQ